MEEERQLEDDEETPDAQQMLWEANRSKAKAWLQSKQTMMHDDYVGPSNATTNWAGQARKHPDVLIAIAGPHTGLVGKHTEKRTSTGLYIKILVGDQKDEVVAVDDEDLEWYDDFLERVNGAVDQIEAAKKQRLRQVASQLHDLSQEISRLVE